MSSFKFDENAFKKVANAAVKGKTQEMQRLMDRLGRELKGQPLEIAKSRLKREWERDGGKLTDPELTKYATALTDGTQITFDYKGLR